MDTPKQPSQIQETIERSSTLCNGTLITRDRWAIGEGTKDERTLIEIEAVEAGGEGSLVGDTGYAIFKQSDGTYGYTVHVSPTRDYELDTVSEPHLPSREAALAQISQQLLTAITALRTRLAA